MVQVCPQCNAENRDIAKFCDQCAAALTPDAVATTTQPAAPAASAMTASAASPGPKLNWTGLIFLLAVVLAVVLIAIMPAKRDQAQLGISQNPSPAASPEGGNPHGMGTMEDVMAEIEQLKTTLEADPLDGAALMRQYELYGQIGQGEKVRPYLEAAIAAVRADHESGELNLEEARRKLSEVALAGLAGQDSPGAILALEYYHELDPKNLGVIATLGNLNYGIEEAAEAIRWYDQYLARATPDTQGEEYWNVSVDKATMHMHLGENDGALEILERVTNAQPEHWSAWYNSSQAYLKLERREDALAALSQAEEVAGDALQRWKTESRIAELEGREPPPMPNPHADGSVPMTLPDDHPPMPGT